MASGPVGLFVDWDSDGFGTGAHDNLSSILTHASYSRGSSPEITGAAQAGQAVFTVLNPSAIFNPDNASGPLYGKLHDGPPVWFGLREDGTIAGTSTATVRGRFAGRVTEVVPLPVPGGGTSTPLAQIICEDPLALYGRIPVKLSDDCSTPLPEERLFGVVLNSAEYSRYPFLWPDGWTTDLAVDIIGPNPPDYRSSIVVGHGPAGSSLTITTDPPGGDTLGNSVCLFAFGIANVTTFAVDSAGVIGTEYMFPDMTVSGQALLLAVMSRITSAGPYSNPLTDWTDVPGFFDQDPLGDRQSVNAETRDVTAGTYGGVQSPEGVEAADANLVVVYAFDGTASIIRKGTSGIIRSANDTLTVALT